MSLITSAADRKKKIKEILAARDAADQEIFAKAQMIESRRETIKDIAYTRQLTKSEIAELKDITGALGALSHAHAELGLMTVIALEKSDEVIRLARVVEATNSDIKSKLKDVSSIAQQIKKLGDLIKTMDAVVSGLAKLAALL